MPEPWKMQVEHLVLLVGTFFLAGAVLGFCFGLQRSANICAGGTLECECVR